MKKVTRLKKIAELKKETGMDISSFKKYGWGFVIKIRDGSAHLKYIYYNGWLKRIFRGETPEKTDFGFVIRSKDSFSFCVPGVGESDNFFGTFIEHDWWFEVHDSSRDGVCLIRKDDLHPSLWGASFKMTTWGNIIHRHGGEERLVSEELIANAFRDADSLDGEIGEDTIIFILFEQGSDELCLCLPSMECTEFCEYNLD